MSPDARRAQLTAAAIAVFARRGLSGARHVDVAEAAGVSLPSVFHYFSTREDLVDAVLSAVEAFFVDMAEGVHRSRQPAPAVLLAQATAFVAAVDAHRDYVRVWLDWSTAVRGALWTRYVAVQDRILGIVIPTIRRGQRAGELRSAVDPEHLARLFIGAGYMVTLMRLSDESPARVMEFAKTVVRVSAAGS